METAEQRVPDAIMIPDEWKGTGNAITRSNTLLDHAEKLLGVDRKAGGRAHVRHAAGGMRYCTTDPRDTILFPTMHAREGQQRYDWVPQADGAVLGYLKQDAKEAGRA